MSQERKLCDERCAKARLSDLRVAHTYTLYDDVKTRDRAACVKEDATMAACF